MKAIVAVDKKWAIGKDNNLLFRIPADMRFFVNTTKGGTVIMGRNTYESIGKPLVGRRNIIITHDPRKYKLVPATFYGFAELYREMQDFDDKTFVIGGEQIYKTLWHVIDEIFITQYDREYPEANKHFPNLDQRKEFKMIEKLAEGEYDGFKYTTSRWSRIAK